MPRKKIPNDTTGDRSGDLLTSSALRYPRPSPNTRFRQSQLNAWPFICRGRARVNVRTTVGSGPTWIISQAYDQVVLALEPCIVLEQTGCWRVWRQTELQSSVSYSATQTYQLSQYFLNAFLVLIVRGVHL
jgi:hypothetical protein